MIIELHLLQNVAPSCLNRDDANAPKDCEFGGHRRARISSQCIKRSIRTAFLRELPDKTGRRTKLLGSRLAEKLTLLLPGKTADAIGSIAAEVTAACWAGKDGKSEKTNVLVFFDDAELDAIARAAAEAARDAEPEAGNRKKKKDAESPWVTAAKQVAARPVSFDIALFGRMLAEQPGKNIDGACQVAHAISTNRVSMEFDFFTAVDDLQPRENTGAGMMGTVGFNSACFYRYAVIHFDRLLANLNGDTEAAKDAVTAFITASFTEMPTGKQNSFAAHNPPSFALAAVRGSNMPWSLANAFEQPIRPAGAKGVVAGSVHALTGYWQGLSARYPAQAGVTAAAMLALPASGIADEDVAPLAVYKKESLDELLATVTGAIG